MQHAGGTRADLFGDREQQVAVHRQREATLPDFARDGQQYRSARLVVQVPGADEPRVGHVRLGIERNEVADIDAEFPEVVTTVEGMVDAHFDGIPADGERVDLGIVSVSRCLDRQDRSHELAVVGVDGRARAFGEAARPRADRAQGHAAVVFQFLDHCPERVEMHDNRSVGTVDLTFQVCAYRAAAGHLVGDAEPLQLLVGESGRTRYGEQLAQDSPDVVHIRGDAFHCCSSPQAAVCGNR